MITPGSSQQSPDDTFERVIIKLNLSPRNFQAIQASADYAGIEVDDWMRNALRVYLSMQEYKEQGKRILVADADCKPEKEVLIP